MTVDAVVIGAGPYGLAVGAHLIAAGASTRIIGGVMHAWDAHMPRGMLLRTDWRASHIADPDSQLSLDRYAAETSMPVAEPIRLEDFVRYGRWYQERAAPGVEEAQVTKLASCGTDLQVFLDTGEEISARHVVVATGLTNFEHVPPIFAGITPVRVSHSSEYGNLAVHAGKRVMVVGGGQSAFESAALLHEAGAQVEIVTRTPATASSTTTGGTSRTSVFGALRYLYRASHAQRLYWRTMDAVPGLQRLMYPPGTVGGPPFNWLMGHPNAVRRMSDVARRSLNERLRVPPSDWLWPRLATVPIRYGRAVRALTTHADAIRLELDDGTQHETDHVLLATGYVIDMARHPFLSSELRSRLQTVGGAPRLGRAFESSVPGLHFVGPVAAASFGPIMESIAGTRFAARSLENHIVVARRATSARSRL